MKLKRLALLMVPVALTLAGCSDYDNGYDVKSIEYDNEFINTFGKVDPNQDWSMATRVNAEVNLPGIKGDAKMNVMTANPRNGESRLLAQMMLKDGVGSLSFDAIKGNDNVFVTVEQDKEYVIFSSYQIQDGFLAIGNVKRETRAGVQVSSFSTTCPTTKDGDLIEINLPYTPLVSGGSSESSEPVSTITYITYNYNKKTLEEWKELTQESFESQLGTNHSNFQYNQGNTPFKWQSIVVYIEEGNPNAGFSGLVWDHYELLDGAVVSEEQGSTSESGTVITSKVKFQYLSGVETKAATPWLFGWGYNLFGTNAIFQESVTYYLPYKTAINSKTEVAEGEVGYQKYGLLYGEDELESIEAGFEITVSGGSVEMPFIYGATITPDQFGYVYWQEGEDPLSKPHYILMDDARPNSNIYWDEWGAFEGSKGSAVGNMSLSVFSNFEAVMNTKDNGVKQCHCQVGNGKWSVAHGDHDYAEHADWCRTTERDKYEDAEGCNCYCNKRGTGIYSGELAAHTAQCEFYFDDYLAAYNKKVYGSSYKLMYFGDNGENTTGSYNFPSDKTYHIAFFISPMSHENKLTAHDGKGLDLGKYNYSVPELNRRIQHLYNYTLSPSFETGNDTPGSENERGRVKCISWTQNVTDLNGNTSKVTLLGFGDESGDHDLNDIVFMVAGDFTKTTPDFKVAPIKWHMNFDPSTHTDTDLYFSENKTVGKTYSQPSTFPTRDGYTFLGWAETPTGTPISKSNEEVAIKDQTTPEAGKCYYAIWQSDSTPVPDPEYNTWIFACEDLGGTFDYDFNDVVFEVRHEVGSTKLEVRLLAAGGTLPFTLKYNGNTVCTKESAFGQGCNGTVFIQPTPSEWFVASNSVSTDWSVTTNANLFTVNVQGEENSAITVGYNTGNSSTPQVIILPNTWCWPKESVGINIAYPNFNNWVSNSNYVEWPTPVQGTTVTR